MRIAYCDDEKTQSIFLKELTYKWEKKVNSHCDITVYASAEEMLFENEESFSFDFIILDIELDKMNGIDLARRIRRVDKGVMIAFLSNSREHVFEGYEVGAVRYLLKPLTEKQIFPLLDMVQKTMKEENQYIIIGVSGEKIKLAAEDIYYVEALGHYIVIHTGSKTYEVKMNINEMAGKLNINEMSDKMKTRFIVTHRSYLVNLSYIERITRTDCVLSGGHIIPISRNSYNAVNKAFIEFYKGGIL